MEIDIAFDNLDDFIEDLKRKGRKEATYQNYRVVIRNIIHFLNGNEMHCDPKLIGEGEIRYIIDNYLASENSMRVYIQRLGTWLKYNGNHTLDGMGILWNRNGYPNAKWIKEYELQKMMNHCKNPVQRMMLLLGSKCGLRREEMARLKDSDIGDSIRIVGKGHGNGKIRIVPISDKMREEIERYRRWRLVEISGKQLLNDDSFLIWTRASEVHSCSQFAVYSNITRVAAEAGVSMTPHSLRRLFATSLIDKGVDIVMVSRLMGHTSVETTARYIENDQAKLQRAVNILD